MVEPKPPPVDALNRITGNINRLIVISRELALSHLFFCAQPRSWIRLAVLGCSWPQDKEKPGIEYGEDEEWHTCMLPPGDEGGEA